MKLRNISQKVISVGTAILLPDKEIKVSPEIVKTASIKALVKGGFLIIDTSEEKLEAAKETLKKAAEEKSPEESTAKSEEEESPKEKVETEKKTSRQK